MISTKGKTAPCKHKNSGLPIESRNQSEKNISYASQTQPNAETPYKEKVP
jgi:hypothetical protein